MVEQLNEHPIGIGKIKRTRTIAVCPGWLCKWDLQRLKSVGPLIDVLNLPDDEPNVVHLLNGTGLNTIW